jgi:iron complex outermembrane recepter protein
MVEWQVFFLLALMLPEGAPQHRETVVVTGTFEPIPLEETDRAVRVVPLDAARRLLAPSLADLLRLDPSLDLRSRAPGGVQADLSIRGGSFGQTLVMLDGLRLNDPQSGHHNLNIPVPLEAVGRMELLKGAGSAYYGSDAVGGAVNVITREPEGTELRLRAGLGNFGGNSQAGTAGVVWGAASQQLFFSRDFSSGFMENRDYRNMSLASITRARTSLGNGRVVLGHTDRPFGADQFYGNFNSWERTRAWFAGARQEFGIRTDASFAYRRHTDLFVLYRDRPWVYTNRHASESWQAAVRRREPLARNVSLAWGGEAYRDAIQSSNLGRHRRHRGAGYAALEARALRRFSLVAAAREEFFAGGNRFSPTASMGFWATRHLKLRASASSAFRMPSYTDLYYHDPANQGSPDLRPEKAWSYDGGLDVHAAGGRVRGEFTVFHRRERDGIDYIRLSPTDVWRAANYQRIHFTGVETALAVRLRRSQSLDFRYTGLRGSRDFRAGVQSKYVFNYPLHNGSAMWEGWLPGGLLGRARVSVLERRGRDPYAVWDASLVRARSRVRPYLQLTNIGGAGYQEVLGVRMPGRGIAGGVELVLAGGN